MIKLISTLPNLPHTLFETTFINFKERYLFFDNIFSNIWVKVAIVAFILIYICYTEQIKKMPKPLKQPITLTKGQNINLKIAAQNYETLQQKKGKGV